MDERWASHGNLGGRRKSIFVGVMLALALALTPVGPASGQVTDFDLSCGASASTAQVDWTFVSVEGSNSCGRSQDRIDVHVCILYNGAPVNCASASESDSSSVSASTSFPCVPGTWSSLAIGTASNGKGGVAASLPVIVLPGECSPLGPRP